MCVPTNLGNALSAVSSVVGTLNEYNTLKKNNEYRTQVALNNAKIAQSEALRQKQLGIEKARIETVEGLRNVSRLRAQNASSNLDSASFTNELGYKDVYDYSSFDAKTIQTQYDNNALSYFNQANSYLNQAQNYNNAYENSVMDYSMNALGKIGKVAKDWYDIDKKDNRRNKYVYF